MTYQQRSKRGVMRQSVGLGLLLGMAVLLANPVLAQQPSPEGPAKKPAVRKKAAGRLPAHFASVVSPKQRDSIYKVQADYAAKLETLQAQITALLKQRDRDVDAVLDADQLAEVTKKREDAKKRRAARNSSRPSSKAATDG